MDREEFEKLIEPLKESGKYKIYRIASFATGKPIIEDWYFYEKETGLLILSSEKGEGIEEIKELIKKIKEEVK